MLSPRLIRSPRRALITAAALLLAAARPALAWNDAGHQVVADIAWQELTPANRAKATAILKQHPQYKRDLLAYLPKANRAVKAGEETDIPLYVFTHAAGWPDVIRDEANPMSLKYHKAKWHFIDMSVVPDGEDTAGLKIPKKPATREWNPTTPDADPGNILQALIFNEQKLKDPATTIPEKAVALCWYIHLVGDVHQPLHCATFYSKDFPTGDSGGNSFIVGFFGIPGNLHSAWDYGVGPGFLQPVLLKCLTTSILKGRGREKFAEELKVTDYGAWADDSHKLAEDVVYDHGKLKGLNQFHWLADQTQEVPPAPDGYQQKIADLAQDRVALAGHRLGDKLTAIFDILPAAPEPTTAPATK